MIIDIYNEFKKNIALYTTEQRLEIYRAILIAEIPPESTDSDRAYYLERINQEDFVEMFRYFNAVRF